MESPIFHISIKRIVLSAYILLQQTKQKKKNSNYVKAVYSIDAKSSIQSVKNSLHISHRVSVLHK